MEQFKGTKGEWSIPHFANKETTCDCRFVLSEQYCGSIATIDWSKDRSIENGDNPPLDEAIANAHLISSAPELLEALQVFTADYSTGYRIMTPAMINKAQKAIHKALGL